MMPQKKGFKKKTDVVGQIQLALDRIQMQNFVNMVIYLLVPYKFAVF